MNRIHCKGILLSCLLIAMGCKEKTAINDQSITKPNLIIIMADDQGYGDLGHHGNPSIKTPNLDTFAQSSLELTNFHVGTTCAPTRAGLMTGRNANRNNAWHTIAGCSILKEDEETMAEVFAKNGYETAMFGKWHLGDNYPFRPHDRGFQHALYHGGGGVNQTPDYWNNDYFDDTYFRNGKPEKFEGYCTDVWFNEATSFIEKERKDPFFIYLPLNAAHGPFNVPESYAKMYDDAPLTEEQKRFYGMITNIDDNFGKLVSYLKENKLFEDTIIIYTTDNGTAAGIRHEKNGDVTGYNAGLKGTKGSHYDGGHRVPFIISWPNGSIAKGTANNELAAHVDLLPTLTELAGIPFKEKKPMDGNSVAKIWTGEQENHDRMLVIDTQRNQLPEKGRNSCVMSTNWRLVNGEELYNIIDDEGQTNDVAGQYPEIVAKMQAFYDSWWTSIEPDIGYAEIPLGHPQANPTLITVHDMHTNDNIPWNQVQIREGKSLPEGFYSVKIQESGRYRFKLYRYPPESGLNMNASVQEITGTSYIETLPQGTSIQPISATVELENVKLEGKANPNEPFAQLEGELEKGSYKLLSTFTTASGERIPAYYTLVEKY
tara:strand:- start:226 stop:2028 length:1803 start_codon:yes stop_codon:yes gene_type:complete